MARFYRELAGLATDYITHKRRQLNQGQPKTVTDSGGNITEYTWSGHDLNQNRLRKVKQIRETGGIVAFLFEAKATMRFGTGAELQAEDDDLQTFLNESFGNVDLLTLDLGADATWYPYAPAEFVETRGGDFSHVEPIEPWTMLPQTDPHGEIVAWEQHTQAEHGDPTVFQPSEIASITLNKSAARDRVGVSEVLRSEEEITQYKQNQEAVNKAIEIAGFPHHIWTVGSEGRTPVDDTDLRRVRNLIDNMDGDTQFVVGPDVDHDKITAAEFDFEGVTKRDLRVLTTAVGLPLEIAGYGREGLGSGSEADLIMSLLALQNEVTRRRYEVQFVEEFVRPVVEEYSAFSAGEAEIEMHIPAFLDDQSELTELIQKVGDYMSTAEVRERLDLPPLEDDEMAESYRSPQQVEEAEEGDPQDADPFGGMFSDAASDAVDSELENRDLSFGEGVPEWDQHYLSMLTDSVWAEGTDRALIAESEVPEMVTQRIRDAINSGALFSQFDSIPSDKLADLRTEFADMLDHDGWTTDDLVDQLQEFEPSLSDSQAETVARTESQAIVNTARKEAYEDRGLADEAVFRWVSQADNRRTDACEWLSKQTEDGVSLERLKELIAEAPEHDEDMQDNLARPDDFLPHINCRSTWVRHVE